MTEVLLIGAGTVVVLWLVNRLILWAMEDPVYFDDE